MIFLHGLLGSQDDWSAVLSHLQKNPAFYPLALDLPGHGSNQALVCQSFAAVRGWLDQTLQNLIGSQPFWLVGYSLGGRIALDYALQANNPNLQGAILEGANLGLATEEERAVRLANDQAWAERFSSEPIESVLEDWYQQAVFADLNLAKRQALIAKRKHNDGRQIAQILMATSLAKQPYYLKQLKQATNIHFVIGQRDKKFRTMVEFAGLNHHILANAGHNAHWENPQAFADLIAQKIQK
ncbi:2-succinyl-6-hydroxy-2,4-cyclohexadiene-1-carboxylate synthase [Pasteurellaceae bacterium RH1A]|nr:2-succinyl-6-hydroxy-2,4-cyclohexadiene-1-carboxylate synthase [Pasteurellaceae bacterium RH1A]